MATELINILLACAQSASAKSDLQQYSILHITDPALKARIGELSNTAWMAASPVVLVSSTTLMSDIPMLALWCGALFFWMEGMRSERWAPLLRAAGLAGLALLTKYFALALIPLLAAHGWLRRRRPGRWLVALTVPVLVAVGYAFYLHWRYGFDPIRDVGAYALGFEATGIYAGWERGLVGLARQLQPEGRIESLDVREISGALEDLARSVFEIVRRASPPDGTAEETGKGGLRHVD